MSASPADSTAAPPEQGRLISWLVPGLLLAAAAGLVAAHVPGRFKLIGLFSVAVGLLCGWGLGELAARRRARPRKAVLGVGAFLVLTSLLVTSAESFRLYRAERQREFAGNPVGLAAAQMQARGNVPPEVAAEFARAARERGEKLAESQSLPAFAAHRLQQVAHWPARWPVVFWGLEILAGTAAGAFMLARRSR